MSFSTSERDFRSGFRTIGEVRDRAAGSRKERQPRVLIAAKHGAIGRGFRIALESAGFKVSGEFAAARAAVDAALRTRPDVCLVDLRLAAGSTSVIQHIAEQIPSCRVVLLTDSIDETDLIGAIRAGAAGSLPKDIEPRRLPIALRAILAGEAAVPRRQVYRLIEEIQRQQTGGGRSVIASGREVRLTKREMEVLEHLAEEHTTAQIALSLGTSAGTVRSHIHAVRQKLGVDPRAAAVEIVGNGALRESTLVPDIAPRRTQGVGEHALQRGAGRLTGP